MVADEANKSNRRYTGTGCLRLNNNARQTITMDNEQLTRQQSISVDAYNPMVAIAKAMSG